MRSRRYSTTRAMPTTSCSPHGLADNRECLLGHPVVRRQVIRRIDIKLVDLRLWGTKASMSIVWLLSIGDCVNVLILDR